MSARACSSAPLSTRESFPDGRRHAFVCPSAMPRPRARQAAESASRYREAEGAGPRSDDDAFRVGARTAEAVAVPRRTSGRPPKRFRRRGACRRRCRPGWKRNGQQSNQALSGRRDSTSTRDL